jgi:hypothetical protein
VTEPERIPWGTSKIARRGFRDPCFDDTCSPAQPHFCVAVKNLIRGGWLALSAVVVMGSAGSAEAIEISQIAIDRGLGQSSGVGSWFVEISVGGVDLESGILSSPTGASITLGPTSQPGEISGGTRYADLLALDSAFPLGTWSLSLNGGAVAGSLPYDPLLTPNGSAPISSPTFGESGLSLTPTMLVDNQCTNCELYSGSTAFGATALVGRVAMLGIGAPLETIPVAPTTTQIDFSSPLRPATRYRFETSVATNNYLPFQFGSDAFAYYQLATQTQSTDFATMVPEPGTGLLLAGGLLLLSARRRSAARTGR